MLNYKRRRNRERPSNGDELQLKQQGNQLKKFEYLGSRLLDLPSSIIVEILIRNPIKEILHCRCVCKTLRSLISDPCFIKYFISRTPFLGMILCWNNNYLFLKLKRGGYFWLHKLKLVNTDFIPQSLFLDIIGCSNGLICLWDRYSADNYKIYITNPVLSEFALLPNPKSDKFAALKETYGFCFCPKTGQYKVIKIKTRWAFLETNHREYYRKTEVWILVVGSGKWKYVGDAPFPYCGKFCHAILNGRLHWIVEFDLKVKGPIYLQLHSLDITEEKAHPIAAPPELRCKNSIKLGVLGEYLSLFKSTRSNHLEIWSMREYGVATSWTKDFIVTTSIRGQSLKPLAIQKNGMILMSDHWGSVFRYGPKEGEFAKVYDFHGDGMDQAVVYTPSFLSLEHISSGACLKVQKVKSYNWDQKVKSYNWDWFNW